MLVRALSPLSVLSVCRFLHAQVNECPCVCVRARVSLFLSIVANPASCKDLSTLSREPVSLPKTLSGAIAAIGIICCSYPRVCCCKWIVVLKSLSDRG